MNGKDLPWHDHKAILIHYRCLQNELQNERGKPASMNADVVIVGAGIIGSSCAYFLARAGLKVCVVERAGLAGGTSSSGEGNILVSDKDPGPELELARRGYTLWKQLAGELSHDFEFE